MLPPYRRSLRLHQYWRRYKWHRHVVPGQTVQPVLLREKLQGKCHECSYTYIVTGLIKREPDRSNKDRKIRKRDTLGRYTIFDCRRRTWPLTSVTSRRRLRRQDRKWSEQTVMMELCPGDGAHRDVIWHFERNDKRNAGLSRDVRQRIGVRYDSDIREKASWLLARLALILPAPSRQRAAPPTRCCTTRSCSVRRWRGLNITQATVCRVSKYRYCQSGLGKCCWG